MKWLLLALGSMFIQQAFITLSKVLPAVLAPVVLIDLNIDPTWLGIYISLMALSALVVQVSCGSFIARYGALRISQVSLVMGGLGLALAPVGLIPILILSALTIGGGGASTPASSHLLGHYSSKKWAPLVFSIKQTAVPAGILVAGLLGPFLSGLYGWRNTFVIIAVSCIIFSMMLEPLRLRFDSDRDPTRRFNPSDLKTTITLVLGQPELRRLAVACFAFVGLQATFIAYFVIYLTHIGYSLAEAGQIFAFATSVAVLGRIFWGWLSSTYVSPQIMLALLALAMASAVGLASCFDDTWSTALITLISACVSATVFSWHGVLLAETARLAPDSMRGTITGGVLSFGQFGGLVLPLVYSAILGLTGSYRIGFVVCSLPALVVGIVIIFSARKTKLD
jgi:MFS family permease